MWKKPTLTLCCYLLCCTAMAQSHRGQPASDLCFIENKGQIRDQNAASRPDIQYSLQAPGINIFVGNGALHYQFIKTTFPDRARGKERYSKDAITAQMADVANILESATETYRMDVALLGANQHARVVAEDIQAYYENYFLTGCPQGGVQAHTCKKITYQEIYPGIDWVLLVKNGKLEHEFKVKPGGNPADIRLQYNGQTALTVNHDGSLTAVTPMGSIQEHAPICYASANYGILPSGYKLSRNILSYDVANKDNIIIDPALEWGTYYGPDSTTSTLYSVVSDDSAHIYTSGLTWGATAIATSGSYQSVFGGSTDAFLVKFDSLGHRRWATYYGGSGSDWAQGMACDHAGNIYVGGTTSSFATMATAGAQQTTYGGGWDCFLARFDTAGVLQWSTYLGDRPDEYAASVACDASGHVYISGVTNSSANIASAGSFLPVAPGGHSAFLVQYDAATGLRNWGTYYGGSADDYSGGICTDKFSNVYMSGYTASSTGVATAGTWQDVMKGPSDAFLVKFDASGTRLWATYYGGEAAEAAGAVVCDSFGNPFMLGATGSDTFIASAGCYQPLRGGGNDAFIALFEPINGYRAWGTYFGGPDVENVTSVTRIASDDSGSIYITGFTASTSGIASAGAVQPTYGGGDNDAFLAKYNRTGQQAWATYYGGASEDESRACTFDGQGVYICGKTNSTSNIATPGAFLTTGGGEPFYYESFLAKYGVITPCVTGTISGPDHLCIGDTIQLVTSMAGGIWSTSAATTGTVSDTGSVTGVAAGTVTITYQYFSGCYVTFTDTVKDCSVPPPDVTGVRMTSSSNLAVIYPNPASDIVSIKTEPGAYNAYTIGTVAGQVVRRGKLKQEVTEINIAQLPPGLYCITLTGMQPGITRKLVVR